MAANWAENAGQCAQSESRRARRLHCPCPLLHIYTSTSGEERSAMMMGRSQMAAASSASAGETRDLRHKVCTHEPAASSTTTKTAKDALSLLLCPLWGPLLSLRQRNAADTRPTADNLSPDRRALELLIARPPCLIFHSKKDRIRQSRLSPFSLLVPVLLNQCPARTSDLLTVQYHRLSSKARPPLSAFTDTVWQPTGRTTRPLSSLAADLLPPS